MLASAAVELSQPKEAESSGPALKEVRGKREEGGGPKPVSRMHPHPPFSLIHKPWEDIIKERLKAKTKIISKVCVLNV